MAIAFDAASTTKGTASPTISWSHTCAAGSKMLLVVGISSRVDQGSGGIAVTYNGVSMTQAIMKADTGGTKPRAELWYLVAPASGANTIQVTMSASGQEVVCGATSWSGVDDLTPIGVTGSDYGGGTSRSVVLTPSVSGSMFVDCFGQYKNNTMTVGAGQTQRWNDTQSASCGGAGSNEAGSYPSTTTMSWSMSGGAQSVLVVIELIPYVSSASKSIFGNGIGYISTRGLLLNTSSPHYRVGLGFTAGSYTNVNSGGYVLKTSFNRDFGDAFDDLSVGTARVSLQNTDGRFSPDNPGSPYAGQILPDVPLIISVTHGNSIRTLFTGNIESYKISPELKAQTVDLSAKDFFHVIKDKVITTSIYTNYNIGSLYVEVLSFCALTSSQMNIDTITETTPYAWWQDKKASEAFFDITKVGDYRTYVSGAGVVNVRNRYYDVQGTSVASFAEFKNFDYSFDKNSIINGFSLKSTPRLLKTSVGPMSIAWLNTSGTDLLAIPAAGGIGFTLEFVNPDNPDKHDTPANSVTVASYSTNTQTNGLGTDLTAATSISMTIFGASAICSLYNANSLNTAWITGFRLHGYPIIEQPQIISVVRDSSSQALYGINEKDMESNLIGNPDYIRQYTTFIVADNAGPKSDIAISIVNCLPAIYDIELGQTIAVTESNTFANSLYTVTKMSHTITTDKGLQHQATYNLKFWKDRLWLILDSPTRGLLDTDKLGW